MESSPEGEAAIGCHAVDGINPPPVKGKVVEIPFIYQRLFYIPKSVVWFSKWPDF